MVCLMTRGTNSGDEVTLGLHYVCLLFSIEIICESMSRAQNHVCLLPSASIDGEISSDLPDRSRVA